VREDRVRGLRALNDEEFLGSVMFCVAIVFAGVLVYIAIGPEILTDEFHEFKVLKNERRICYSDLNEERVQIGGCIGVEGESIIAQKMIVGNWRYVEVVREAE
jgi:hypothetical protein